MAALPTQSFISIVQTIASGVQGRVKGIILDFQPGAALRAVAEGFASICMWLQSIALQIMALTRAATSAGTDLDSWMADYNFVRLGGTFATGTVTFSVLSVSTASYFIPVGSVVMSADGTVTFEVTVDLTNSAYVATPVAGYKLAAGLSSITVPVQALATGTVGNVQAGALNQMVSAIPGIDAVVNAAAFTNGVPPETDPQFRSRFIAYIASLSEGTIGAVKFAVTSLQTGAQATVLENQTQQLVVTSGGITVTVDDGSGSPPATFMTAAGLAVSAVRAGGVPFAVFPPIIINVVIVINLGTIFAGYVRTALIASVNTAVTTYVNTIPLGSPLTYAGLVQVIMNATPGLTGQGVVVTINGGTADIAATLANVIKVSSANLTIV